jgi:ubiquinone biosynthesis protein
VERASDTNEYAFTEEGPWEIREQELAWLGACEGLRQEVSSEMRRLLDTSLPPPPTRALEVAATLGARGAVPGLFGRLVLKRGSAYVAQRFREAFRHLGPTFIKLGQILSAGRGIFPEEVVREFALLRDQVPPAPFSEISRTVSAELGAPLSQVFSYFSPTPAAAASIAQVHYGQLADGSPVAVKVQRPGIEEVVRRDIRVMAHLAPFLARRVPVFSLINPPAIVELFADTILEELDFRLEAQNMLDIARVIRQAGNTAIVVPRPHPELVTRRVLVMQRLGGLKWSDAGDLRRQGVDTAGILREAILSLLEGAMVYGVFHGDLHGGNLFLTEEGKVVLLDFGITGRLAEKERRALLRLMIAGLTNDVPGQLDAYRDLGALPPDIDKQRLIKELGLDRPPVDPLTLTSAELMSEVRRTMKVLLSHKASLPKPLMLFVKDLIFLDEAIAMLAPEVDLIEEMVALAGRFISRHKDKLEEELGVPAGSIAEDIDAKALKANLGLGDARLTYSDLQERRRLLRQKIRGADR